LLGCGGSRAEDAFAISKGRILFVKAKRQKPEPGLIPYTQEAVSQAIALLKPAKYVGIFCFISLSEYRLPAFQKSVSVYLIGSPGFSLS
jgi:hypothetical protein